MATTQQTKVFLPFAVGTEDNFRLRRGPSKVEAIDPGITLEHDNLGSYLTNLTVSTDKQSFQIDRAFPESMGTIIELRIMTVAIPWGIINSTIKLSVALTAAPTWVDSAVIGLGVAESWIEYEAALARPGGGSWTEADLRDLTFQFAIAPDLSVVQSIVGVTSLWVEVDYTPTDESGGAIPPEFPSRKLRYSRLPAGILDAELRGDAIDFDLLEDFEVVHSEGEHGWTQDNPRRFRCIQSDLDLNTMRVRLKAVDLHDRACMFWHTGISPYDYQSGDYYPDGPGILHPGCDETFARASAAWILDGSNRIVELGSNVKRLGPDGILIEGAATNYVINSAFIDGWTGWTQITAGQMSLDTATVLLHPDIAAGHAGTNQTAKLEYLDGVGDCAIHRTLGTSFTNDEWVALAVWHTDSDDDYPPRVRIQNTTTNEYYNAATELWQVGAVDNDLTGRETWGKSVIVFPQDDTTGALNIMVLSPSSAGSSEYTNIGQIQVEWASGGQQASTSPIPTYDATITRAVESLSFSTDEGRRIWPSEGGTLIVRCKFYWGGTIDTSGAPGDNKGGAPLILLYYDADNWAYLSFYPDNLKFTMRAHANEVQITSSLTPTENETYVFAARWTSALAERTVEIATGTRTISPSPRTLSLFIDGVKGTDGEQIEDIEETAEGDFNIGSLEAGFGGYLLIPEPAIAFSHIEVVPWPLTDDEIKARP